MNEVKRWDEEAVAKGIVLGAPGWIKAGAEALGRPRPFGPSPIASSRCQSGRRPYCTCDTCF